MNARDLMTRNPLVVTPGQPLEDAARVMRDLDVGAVPVVDDPREPRLLGVITDRDMAVRCLAAGHAGECTVGEHMTAAPLHTVSPTADADEVMEMMKVCQVRRVLVTDGDRLVGIIAQADLARREGPAAPLKVASVLEALSEPAHAGVPA